MRRAFAPTYGGVDAPSRVRGHLVAARHLPPKGSNLLDVMRTTGVPKNAGAFGRGGWSGGAASGGGAGGAGISRRGLALGGTALGLLVVLAFAIGMAFGRRGGAPPDGSGLALARPSISGWVLRGWLPGISAATTQRLETAVPRELAVRAPALANRVRVERDERGRAGTLTVVVSGFATQDEAQRTLDALATWSVESCFPFRQGVVEPGR
jgi:hypothetical protein